MTTHCKWRLHTPPCCVLGRSRAFWHATLPASLPGAVWSSPFPARRHGRHHRAGRLVGSMAELGMVGLGRMGANIVRRLMRGGHRCVVYDVNADTVASLAAEGAEPAESLSDLASKLDPPRAVWAMVPAGEITERTVADVAEALDAGDAVIDGGNSYYRDDLRRAATLAERGIDYIDCGTSGGVFGLERGYCLMIGGPHEAGASPLSIF